MKISKNWVKKNEDFFQFKIFGRGKIVIEIWPLSQAKNYLKSYFRNISIEENVYNISFCYL